MRPATSRQADGPQNLRRRGRRRAPRPGARGVVVVVRRHACTRRATCARCIRTRLDAFGVRRRRAARRGSRTGGCGAARPGRAASAPRPRAPAADGARLAVGRDRHERRRRRRRAPSTRWSTPACDGIVVAATGNGTRPRDARGGRCAQAAARGCAVLRSDALPRRRRGRARPSRPRRFAVGRRAHAGEGAGRADRCGCSRAGAERGCASAPRSDDVERDLDVAARRVRVRADLVRGLDELLRLRLVHAGDVTCSATWMPKPCGIGPMPTSAVIEVSAGSAIFCMPATAFIAPMKQAE